MLGLDSWVVQHRGRGHRGHNKHSLFAPQISDIFVSVQKLRANCTSRPDALILDIACSCHHCLLKPSGGDEFTHLPSAPILEPPTKTNCSLQDPRRV